MLLDKVRIMYSRYGKIWDNNLSTVNNYNSIN